MIFLGLHASQWLILTAWTLGLVALVAFVIAAAIDAFVIAVQVVADFAHGSRTGTRR